MSQARGQVPDDDIDDEVPPVPQRAAPRVPDHDVPETPEEQLPELSADEVVGPPDPSLPPVEEEPGAARRSADE